MKKYSAQKSVKSMNPSVTASRDFQSLDVSTQTRGKIVAKPKFLCFVKSKTVIEIA